MIDTVVLTLNKSDFILTNPEKFTPVAQWVFNSALSFHVIQSKQNPTKKELLCGIYKPRLTLSHRSNTGTVLRIELSLSKLLFRNKFIELQ